MRPLDATLATAGLVLFVPISSLLGLTGWWIWTEPGDAIAFFASIWAQSLVADAVFTIGSMLAATLAFLRARESIPIGIAAGALGTYAVYVASFLLLPDTTDADADGFVSTLEFIVSWGWVGLLFGALAPTIAARATR